MALAIIHDGGGGDAMADREFAVVAELKIGDPFIPIFAFQASQVRSCDERFFAVDFLVRPDKGTGYRSHLSLVAGRQRLRHELPG